jgi:hypothetical protein
MEEQPEASSNKCQNILKYILETMKDDDPYAEYPFDDGWKCKLF